MALALPENAVTGSLYVNTSTGDEIRRILLESVIPFLKEVLMTRKLIQKNGSKSPLPTDIVFADYDLYDDYVEMVIQFGVSASEHILFICVCVCLCISVKISKLIRVQM